MPGCNSLYYIIFACVALQIIRDQYVQHIGNSLDWAKSSLVPEKTYAQKVVRTTGAARQQALTALQQLADKYSETEAAKKSRVDVETLKAIPQHWR